MMTWSPRTPIALISSVQAIAAAPAPLTTTLMSPSSRPVRWQALISPAAVMIAVPCWSSWNTGMFIRSLQRLLDDEAVGGGDVLEVDPAEARLEQFDARR